MNRTRKIVAAAVGTAVVLVIIAMVLVPPTLHTQTPVSTSPPGNGGTGNGGGAGTGTGTGTGSGTGSGTGTGTSPSCNATRGDEPWDDHNETDMNDMVVHTLDDGNWTNDTGGHDGMPCDSSSVDHDQQGDRMSDGHNGHEASDLVGTFTEDALSLAPILSGWLTTASHALTSVGGLFFEPFTGLVSSGLAFAPSR